MSSALKFSLGPWVGGLERPRVWVGPSRGDSRGQRWTRTSTHTTRRQSAGKRGVGRETDRHTDDSTVLLCLDLSGEVSQVQNEVPLQTPPVTPGTRSETPRRWTEVPLNMPGDKRVLTPPPVDIALGVTQTRERPPPVGSPNPHFQIVLRLDVMVGSSDRSLRTLLPSPSF